MNGPLVGVRILDLGRAIAGPYGTLLLGDLGAEVIKVEPPEGEMSRTFPGPNHKGESFYYMAFNRSKKSLVLDLGTPSGRQAFYDLVKVSDIVWDNFRPNAMERLGLDYDTLKQINPQIICCSITGYGSSGPYRDWPSYDVIAQGMSGVMSITGEPGRPPVRSGPPLADMAGAIFAALAAVSALAARARTGQGQRIEISLLDACVSLLCYHISYYLCSGIVPGPEGSGHLSLVPYGAYQTKEGYLTVGACWPRIARTLGAEWMIDDPRFSTHAARLEHREEFEAIVRQLFLREKAGDWLEVLRADDIPAGPVNTIDRVVVDPQTLHQKMIVSMEHPLGGEIKQAGNPMKMSGSIEEGYSPPPTLGQHTREILCHLLGYSEQQIRRLKEEEEQHQEELKVSLHKQW